MIVDCPGTEQSTRTIFFLVLRGNQRSIDDRSNKDRNCNRACWTEVTAFPAPHKPFLLLSIMDLAAQRHIDSLFIEFSFTDKLWGPKS
jgi:hypothetical protein